MSKSSQRLSSILTNRMKKTAYGAVGTTLELGTVNNNLSITPDSLRTSIPKGDYMVNLALTGGLKTSTESHSHSGGTHSGHSAGTGSHSHSGGDHSHTLPGLRAGDRVLLAWCGNEPVVIAIVVGS